MTDPLISVIIPTYNRLEYIQQAIDSVLLQTYPYIEILVIDDGSTDGTEKRLRGKYGEKIRYLWQENQGESVARNHGLTLSKGQHVAFLDSDDLWAPKKLAIQAKILEHSTHHEAVAVCSSAWRIDSLGNPIGLRPVGRTRRLCKRQLVDFFTGPKIFAPPSNLLVRKDAMQQLEGFDPRIQYGEDWDFVIRLRHLGAILYTDQPLLFYRVHGSSQQGIPKPDCLKKTVSDHLTIIQKNAFLLNSKHQKQIEFAKARIYEKAAYWCFALDRLLEGLHYLARAGTINQRLLRSSYISQNLGYWVATGALERLSVPQTTEQYFITDFLPQFLHHYSILLGNTPNRQQLLGWFYHNMAYLLIHKNTKISSSFGIKSIKHYPLMILRFRFMKSMIEEVWHRSQLDSDTTNNSLFRHP
jgi:glycosyltransferase involved in cell wall biosynthesis